jgi:hypothetical protein
MPQIACVSDIRRELPSAYFDDIALGNQCRKRSFDCGNTDIRAFFMNLLFAQFFQCIVKQPSYPLRLEQLAVLQIFNPRLKLPIRTQHDFEAIFHNYAVFKMAECQDNSVDLLADSIKIIIGKPRIIKQPLSNIESGNPSIEA